ncbi:MAG: hypothetical protein ACYC0X_29230 [Pirellulaceae bacterium]
MRWLGRGIQPSRTSWYEFRDRFETVLDELNQQVLGQAIASEMTQVTRAALDGTAIAANASRRRLTDMSHLEQRIEQLEAIVKQDERHESPAEIPAWMATTPSTRVGQLARF